MINWVSQACDLSGLKGSLPLWFGRMGQVSLRGRGALKGRGWVGGRKSFTGMVGGRRAQL